MLQSLHNYKMTNKLSLLVILVMSSFYYLFAYHTVRTNFIQVLSLYTLLFLGFYVLKQNSKLKVDQLIYIGVAFRLIFLFAIPNLSDDFYRFLWDGRAVLKGINPYLILPQNSTELITNGAKLYKGMGTMNGSHFTCYPPLNQFAFSIPAIVTNQNLLISTFVMRATLIFSDFVTVIFGVKILRHLNIDPSKMMFYFLNPFIIIELTGNLHYEGMMIAFLSIACFYLLKSKNIRSAIFFAFAVSIKLIPLIFLPVLFKKIGFIKTCIYGAIVILVNIVLFLPFMSKELYSNFMSSIELYFQNFEFNASIYYIIREIGYHVKGYNIIQTVGKVTPIVVVIATLLLSLIRKNKNNTILFTTMLFVITCYYTLSSIVHPWYIAIPLFLSLFTNYKYPLLWSFLIILSYSAYISKEYHENLYLVALEYSVLFVFMGYEIYKNSYKQINSVMNTST